MDSILSALLLPNANDKGTDDILHICIAIGIADKWLHSTTCIIFNSPMVFSNSTRRDLISRQKNKLLSSNLNYSSEFEMWFRMKSRSQFSMLPRCSCVLTQVSIRIRPQYISVANLDIESMENFLVSKWFIDIFLILERKWKSFI